MSPHDDMTPAEAASLASLHAAWVVARQAKDYARADVLRADLMRRGAIGPQLERWHPAFESSDAREERLAARKVAA